MRTGESRIERSLENSDTEFASQYSKFAVAGQIMPSVEGSPLLEFVTGGKVLYLFDRSGPYAANAGAANILVHGILDTSKTEILSSPAAAQQQLEVTGVSGTRGVGRLLEASRLTWVVHATMPLVLSAFETLPEVSPGEWISFETLPPLHGFWLGE